MRSRAAHDAIKAIMPYKIVRVLCEVVHVHVHELLFFRERLLARCHSGSLSASARLIFHPHYGSLKIRPPKTLPDGMGGGLGVINHMFDLHSQNPGTSVAGLPENDSKASNFFANGQSNRLVAATHPVRQSEELRQ